MKKSLIYMIACFLFFDITAQARDEGRAFTLPSFAESDKAYGVYVYMTNSFTITNGGWTKLEYTFELRDDQSIHSEGDFTFPRVGWWIVSFDANIELYGRDTSAMLELRTNGVQWLLLDHASTVNVQTNFVLRGDTHLYVVDTGTVYSVWVQNNDSVERTLKGGPNSAVTRASAIYRGK